MKAKGKSEWQRRYDQSIEVEEARKAEADKSESKWQLLDAMPATGTGLDLLLLPVALAIVGATAFKRLRRRRST